MSTPNAVREIRRGRDAMIEKRNRRLAEAVERARDARYPMRELAAAAGFATRQGLYAFLDRYGRVTEPKVAATPQDSEEPSPGPLA